MSFQESHTPRKKAQMQPENGGPLEKGSSSGSKRFTGLFHQYLDPDRYHLWLCFFQK